MRVSPWIVRFGSGAGAAVRLVCFAHAGGGASTFRPWLDPLAPSIAVRAVQLPARENRFAEAPVATWTEAVASIGDALEALDDRPLVLFGHSMGALLAFETARRLQRDDPARPSALLVSGRPAPHLPGRGPRLGHLPALELVHRVASLYRGVPDAVLEDSELAELMGRALKADFALLESYVHAPGEPLSCPIAAFGGAADPWVTESELRAWERYGRGALEVELFRGDHFYFKAEESQRLLLARIRERCLRAAREYR